MALDRARELKKTRRGENREKGILNKKKKKKKKAGEKVTIDVLSYVT